VVKKGMESNGFKGHPLQLGEERPKNGLSRSKSSEVAEGRIPPRGGQLTSGDARSWGKSTSPRCRRSNDSHRRGSMGRYPFVCAYRRYLKSSRARLGEGTIAERERKLHCLAKVVQQLNDAGKIGNPNPTLLTEGDVIEVFMALKQRGIKRSTLRKYLQMLKAVCRECGNRVVEDMLADGKIKVGNDLHEPFSLDQEELRDALVACRTVGGWRGEVCRFSITMLTFLRLRPGELRTASLRDLDTKRWTFLVANPKGKGTYGEMKRLPVPDVLRPYVLEYLEVRGSMLANRGVKDAEPLIPAISRKGVGVYCQQAFGRLKDEVMKEAGVRFKWKDFRPTGGQLALDAGVPIDQVSRSMRHASTQTTERYYCRARAEPAFARVNEAYNSLLKPEPAIRAEND